ncbi:ABC transporter substrate-binding protein [Agrococcus sp. KRD186]|uniref:ABC transporter substrate-binding protein n=1 Tax=Agrococcus sp. KRD186 TaxID=2729730 RepID=UPI0019CFA010|nr:ABC transporter substrate-binding protein [Agrococcus sp. KRD186]
MNRRILAAIGAVGAAALISGCSAALPVDESEAPTAAEAAVSAPEGLNGSLSVCMDISFPPMEYYSGEGTETPEGVDVDLAYAIGEQFGLPVEIEPTGFDGLLPALSANRCDTVISGILVTEERTQQVPAVGYLDTHRVIMVADGNPRGITSFEDLSGLNVALEGGTSYEAVVDGWNDELRSAGSPEINIHRYPKQTDAVQQLLVGRADAVVTQDTEAAYRIGEDPGTFEVAIVLPDTETFGIYYSDQIEGLGSALEQAVANLSESGEIDRIAADHNLQTEVD